MNVTDTRKPTTRLLVVVNHWFNLNGSNGNCNDYCLT